MNSCHFCQLVRLFSFSGFILSQQIVICHVSFYSCSCRTDNVTTSTSFLQNRQIDRIRLRQYARSSPIRYFLHLFQLRRNLRTNIFSSFGVVISFCNFNSLIACSFSTLCLHHEVRLFSLSIRVFPEVFVFMKNTRDAHNTQRLPFIQ